MLEFDKIFKGNSKTFGQHNPVNSKTFTLEGKPTKKHWSAHLEGGVGIGRVPILDDDTCVWGAIDVDCHEEGETINIESIAKQIFVKGLPLIACRSKSGGVHCYAFASEPIPANLMQKMLRKWSGDIGQSGSEIFPKQVNLRDNQLGNWINLPYHNAADTVRYAVEMVNNLHKQLSLDEFLIKVEEKQLTKGMFESFVLAGHEEAPPCIQSMILEGVPKGYRNEALYAFTIYLRQKMPAGQYKASVLEMNDAVFDRPLALSEANRTIKSASRRDYYYKCVQEPCLSKCNSSVCIGREFGIQESDSTGDGVPDFSNLKAIATDPPVWELDVNGISIIINTIKLRSFPMLAEEIMERLFIVTPILKQKDWMNILSGLMENITHIEAPDSASVSGMVRECLVEYLTRADLNSAGENSSERDLLTRGIPVVVADGVKGKRIIAFRGKDFVTFLKRIRSEELKGNALWIALRKMGAAHKRMRIGKGKVIPVWYVPIDGRGRTMLDPAYDPDTIFIHSDPEKVITIMNQLNF